MASESAHQIELTPDPEAEHRARIVEQLTAFNETQAGRFAYPDTVTALLRNPGGNVVGGLWASIRWQWLTIGTLFVPEGLRRCGHGERLMRAVEAEARSRQCIGGCTDTYSFQARGFYKRLGYAIVGQIDDYPPGHQRFFLSKRFT